MKSNNDSQIGLVYLDRIAKVIGVKSNTMTLETFAPRTISELTAINSVIDNCIFINTDVGEQILELDGFGNLLGFSARRMTKETAGVTFHLEGGNDA